MMSNIKDFLNDFGYCDEAANGTLDNMRDESAKTFGCMEVAGLESMVDCDPPQIDGPLR